MIKLGTKEITDLFLGNKRIGEVRLGEKEIFGADYEVHMWPITGTSSVKCESYVLAYNNYESSYNSIGISRNYKIYRVTSGATGNAVEGSGGVTGIVNNTDGTYTGTGMYARSTKNYGTEEGRKGCGWLTTAYYYVVGAEIVKKMSKAKYQKFVAEQQANKTYVYNTISLK